MLLGVVGALLGLAGLLVLWLVPGPAAEEHVRLSALPAPRGVSPTRTSSGQEVIVEGRVALEQPRLFRDFVAYNKEEETPRRTQRRAPDVAAGLRPRRVVGPGRLYAMTVGSGTHAPCLSDLAAEARTAWWIGTNLGIARTALVVTGVILFAISPAESRETAS